MTMNEAEKYISEHINYRSNFKPNGYHEWVTPEDALRACEITKQETIEKACNYFMRIKECDLYEDKESQAKAVDDFINRFRNAMED